MYGSHGVAHGIVSSFPLRSKADGGYEIVQDVYELRTTARRLFATYYATP